MTKLAIILLLEAELAILTRNKSVENFNSTGRFSTSSKATMKAQNLLTKNKTNWEASHAPRPPIDK